MHKSLMRGRNDFGQNEQSNAELTNPIKTAPSEIKRFVSLGLGTNDF